MSYHVIIRLTHKKVDYYMEWSGMSDCPLTYGLPLKEFKAYYKEEYGNQGMRHFQSKEIKKMLKEKGTTGRTYSLNDLIKLNRAGKKEQPLTKQQIIEQYCLNRK